MKQPGIQSHLCCNQCLLFLKGTHKYQQLAHLEFYTWRLGGRGRRKVHFLKYSPPSKRLYQTLSLWIYYGPLKSSEWGKKTQPLIVQSAATSPAPTKWLGTSCSNTAPQQPLLTRRVNETHPIGLIHALWEQHNQEAKVPFFVLTGMAIQSPPVQYGSNISDSWSISRHWVLISKPPYQSMMLGSLLRCWGESCSTCSSRSKDLNEGITSPA